MLIILCFTSMFVTQANILLNNGTTVFCNYIIFLTQTAWSAVELLKMFVKSFCVANSQRLHWSCSVQPPKFLNTIHSKMTMAVGLHTDYFLTIRFRCLCNPREPHAFWQPICPTARFVLPFLGSWRNSNFCSYFSITSSCPGGSTSCQQAPVLIGSVIKIFDLTLLFMQWYTSFQYL